MENPLAASQPIILQAAWPPRPIWDSFHQLTTMLRFYAVQNGMRVVTSPCDARMMIELLRPNGVAMCCVGLNEKFWFTFNFSISGDATTIAIRDRIVQSIGPLTREFNLARGFKPMQRFFWDVMSPFVQRQHKIMQTSGPITPTLCTQCYGLVSYPLFKMHPSDTDRWYLCSTCSSILPKETS